MKTDDLIALPAEERLALITALWESLSDSTPLSAEQADELARRLRSFDQDRAAAAPWDDLKAELA